MHTEAIHLLTYEELKISEEPIFSPFCRKIPPLTDYNPNIHQWIPFTQVSQMIIYWIFEGCAVCETFSHRTKPYIEDPILNPAVPPGCSLEKSTGLFPYRSRPRGKDLPTALRPLKSVVSHLRNLNSYQSCKNKKFCREKAPRGDFSRQNTH